MQMNRRVGLFVLILGGLAFGLVLGERSCKVVPGTVSEKQDGIEQLIDPYWRPLHQVVVSFEPERDEAVLPPWTTHQTVWVVSLPADEATFDRLRRGSVVSVRYVPAAPDFARLEQYSFAEALFNGLSLDPRESGIVFLVAGLAWLLISHTLGWRLNIFASRPREYGLVLLHLVWFQTLPLALLGIRDLLPPPAGPLLHTTAAIQEIHEIRRVGGRLSGTSSGSSPVDLPVSFQRVLLAFVPAGRDQPVVAVDEVSPGSVPNLERGAAVAFTYAQDQPRVGWIDNASRDFRLANRLFVHGLVTVPFLVLVLGGQLLMLALRLSPSAKRAR